MIPVYHQGIAIEGRRGPFAVTMFGYGAAVSYGYPGGLDLTRNEDR